MRKMKKILALTLSAAMVLSMAVGCGKKDEPTNTTDTTTDTTTEGTTDTTDTETPPADDQPVTLTTVSMMGGTDANTENYKALIEQFQKDHPNVTIEDDSQTADQDWKTKVAADFSVGNEPDVIQYFTDSNASEVLKANKFVTIDEIKAKYPDYAKDILPNALVAASAPDGTSYAVPTVGYWEGLFCNKDLFDKYNLELPTDWDKLTKAIDTFKENKIIPIAVSLSNVPHYWIEFLMMKMAGPEEFTKVPTEVPEDWAKGLSLIKDLKDMGAFPKDTDSINDELSSNYFKNGEAAMHLDGNWFANQLSEETTANQQNTVVVQFPAVPGGKAAQSDMIGGLSSGFYITKKAWDDPAKQKAAVEFVMANTTKEQITKYWGGAGAAAVAVDVPADATPLIQSGIELSSNSTFYPPTDARLSQEAYSTLIAGMVDISNGTKDAAELLKEVVTINNK